MAADKNNEDSDWYQAHERRWGRGSDRLLGVHVSPSPSTNFTELARAQHGSASSS